MDQGRASRFIRGVRIIDGPCSYCVLRSSWFATLFFDPSELGGGDRLDAEPISFFEQTHLGEGGFAAEGCQLEGVGEAGDQLHVDHEPAWVVGGAAGIVVGAFLVELGVVGVARADDLDDPHGGALIAAVVVDRQVAKLHLVTEHVAGLVVANAIPAGGLLWLGDQLIDREDVRFALEEPVLLGHGEVWVSAETTIFGVAQSSRGMAVVACRGPIVERSARGGRSFAYWMVASG
jgi:hypothetical protein